MRREEEEEEGPPPSSTLASVPADGSLFSGRLNSTVFCFSELICFGKSLNLGLQTQQKFADQVCKMSPSTPTHTLDEAVNYCRAAGASVGSQPAVPKSDV